jgi:hypothetical protein
MHSAHRRTSLGLRTIAILAKNDVIVLVLMFKCGLQALRSHNQMPTTGDRNVKNDSE